MGIAVTWRVAATAMLAAFVASGCTTSSPERGEGPATVAADICSLADLAVDDPQTAAERFRSEVHDPLHDITDELLQEDRAAASRLLEAKHAVEQLGRQSDPDGRDLQEALENLAGRMPESPGCNDQ